MLVPNTDESGLRRAPSVIAHGEHLMVSWVDRKRGHVAMLPIDELPR
jgi:hypothetical protein